MNHIQKYFRYRQSLIDQYLKGDMTKAEYLEKNLEAVLSLNMQPFKNVDTVEKGFLNYQYYNAMAKEASMTGEDRKSAQEEANYYYKKKDKATIAVLRLLDYKNITAYFIEVNSKYLKGKLIEVVVNDYQMILHTTSSMILENLRKEGVFEEITKKSLIDGYINQKY